MGIDTKGFDDLVNTLQNLGEVGKKTGKKVLKNSAEIVLQQQKKDAPKDSGAGAEALKIDNAKTKGNTSYIHIGINSENWEQCKGLWFQNWGYTLKSGQQYSKNIGWMNDSFSKVKNKVGNTIINDLQKEIDNILK